MTLASRQAAITEAFAEIDDDDLTDAIAEEIVARVERSHPQADPAFRRRLVHLYTAQALGVAPQPGVITAVELAEWLGMSKQRISDAAATGLARAWNICRRRYPELKHEVQSSVTGH